MLREDETPEPRASAFASGMKPLPTWAPRRVADGSTRMRATGIDARSSAAKKAGVKNAVYDSWGNVVSGTNVTTGNEYKAEGASNIDKLQFGKLTPNLDAHESRQRPEVSADWGARVAAARASNAAKTAARGAMATGARNAFGIQRRAQARTAVSAFGPAPIVTESDGASSQVTGHNGTRLTGAPADVSLRAPGAGRTRITGSNRYGTVSSVVDSSIAPKILRRTAFDAGMPQKKKPLVAQY